jgi:hypothetical protein
VNRPPVVSFALVLTVLAFGVFLCPGAPPVVPAEAETEAALLKAAKTAELHGVAVSQPAVNGFDSDKGVKEWPKLIEKLRDSKDKSVVRVREYIPKRVLEFAAKDGVMEALARAQPGQYDPMEVPFVRGDFYDGYRKLLNDRDFYSEEAFKEVKLDDEAKRLIALGKKRTVHEVALLHWRIMQAIFPDSIPNVPLGFRTIRVQVRDEKDVVLVLSCHTRCRWEVDVKPGAKVTGVILCGYHAQEVELYENPVKAPVVYRAGYAQDGTCQLDTAKNFDGYTVYSSRPEPEASKPRRQFEAGVKELTGKGEFVSMQRESNPKSEPYIIPPKKK